MMKKMMSRMCVVSVLVTSIAWGSAYAQTNRKVAFTTAVPFEFNAGNQTLPAGIYTFEMASGAPVAGDQAGVIVIRDSNRRTYVAVAARAAQALDPQAKSGAVFTRVGDQAYLSQVFQQGKTLGLQLRAPDSESEEARVEPQTVIVPAGSMQ
jgi:hypothetical protein